MRQYLNQIGPVIANRKIVGTEKRFISQTDIVSELNIIRVYPSNPVPFWAQKPVEIDQKKLCQDVHETIFKLNDANPFPVYGFRESGQDKVLRPFDVDLEEVNMVYAMLRRVRIARGNLGRSYNVLCGMGLIDYLAKLIVPRIMSGADCSILVKQSKLIHDNVFFLIDVFPELFTG